MKLIYKLILFIGFSVLFFMSCSKDLGNYDYATVNKLDSVLVKAGVKLEGSSYSIGIGDVLKINPIIYTSNKLDDSDYTFMWIIGGDTISRTKNLELNSYQVNGGQKQCSFNLTSKTTQVTYTVPFFLNVSVSVLQGYYLLTEDLDHNAHMFYKGNALTSKFFSYNKIGEFVLGKNPIALDITEVRTSATAGYFSVFSVATKEGENPVMIGDLRTNLATQVFKKNDAMAFENSSEGFVPNIVKLKEGIGLANIRGKVHFLGKGYVGPNVFDDPLDYNFGDADFYFNNRTFYGLFLMGYDQKNEKLRIFASRIGSAPNSFQESFDNLITINTKDHKILGGTEVLEGSNYYEMLVTKKNNEIFLHKITHGASNIGYLPKEYKLESSKIMPEINNAVDFRFRFGSGLWYFASGRSIYRFSNVGLDLQEVIKLPEDGTGNITSWNFDFSNNGSHKHIVIATYNPNESSALKGSVYTYKIDSPVPANVEKYATYKVVSLHCGFLPY